MPPSPDPAQLATCMRSAKHTHHDRQRHTADKPFSVKLAEAADQVRVCAVWECGGEREGGGGGCQGREGKREEMSLAYYGPCEVCR